MVADDIAGEHETDDIADRTDGAVDLIAFEHTPQQLAKGCAERRGERRAAHGQERHESRGMKKALKSISTGISAIASSSVSVGKKPLYRSPPTNALAYSSDFLT
jgi:hypothetical protein